MRRIVSVLSVPALMAAMSVAMALPSFAQGNCEDPEDGFYNCALGGGDRSGNASTLDLTNRQGGASSIFSTSPLTTTNHRAIPTS